MKCLSKEDHIKKLDSTDIDGNNPLIMESDCIDCQEKFCFYFFADLVGEENAEYTYVDLIKTALPKNYTPINQRKA
jgi:hypothetical protein